MFIRFLLFCLHLFDGKQQTTNKIPVKVQIATGNIRQYKSHIVHLPNLCQSSIETKLIKKPLVIKFILGSS